MPADQCADSMVGHPWDRLMGRDPPAGQSTARPLAPGSLWVPAPQGSSVGPSPGGFAAHVGLRPAGRAMQQPRHCLRPPGARSCSRSRAGPWRDRAGAVLSGGAGPSSAALPATVTRVRGALLLSMRVEVLAPLTGTGVLLGPAVLVSRGVRPPGCLSQHAACTCSAHTCGFMCAWPASQGTAQAPEGRWCPEQRQRGAGVRSRTGRNREPPGAWLQLRSGSIQIPPPR